MITYFLNKKCKIYKPTYSKFGAGEVVDWVERGFIRAKIESFTGEEFIASSLGDGCEISLIIYSKSELFVGDRICLDTGWFEIRHREFYDMPFISYWKGFMVKCDENLSV